MTTKDHERQLFDYVYGDHKELSVHPSESPDFLCELNGDTVLGVEITEYFDSESTARLRKISSYPLEMVTAKRCRHRDDKKKLRIENVTYMPKGDKSNAREVTAIVHRPSSLRERLARLATIVSTKSAKYPTYCKKAPATDLVVYDPDHAFRFDDFQQLYLPITKSDVRRCVITAPFREVFLVTERASHGLVCIPLRAIAFVEEVFVFQRLYFLKQRIK
jgi:hypothetical protein